MTNSFHKHFFDRLQYAGQFYSTTGVFEICDPMVNEVTCENMPINTANQAVVHIRNCPTGRYEVFYEFDRKGEPENIFILHESFGVHDLTGTASKFSFAGNVVTSFGECVCVIESIFRNDASVCFYEIEEEAYYEPRSLHQLVSRNAPYSGQTISRLLAYLNGCVSQECYAYGHELSEIIEPDTVYWNGFRSSVVKSSHWAVDVCSRVKKSYLPFSFIRGGAVFGTLRAQSSVSVLKNRHNMPVVICISLKEQDTDKKEPLCESSNIIPFQDI